MSSGLDVSCSSFLVSSFFWIRKLKRGVLGDEFRSLIPSLNVTFEDMVEEVQVVDTDLGEFTLMNDTIPVDPSYLNVKMQVSKLGGKCYTLTAGKAAENHNLFRITIVG